MRYNSIFVTNSCISKGSGGGIVGYNLVETLQKHTVLRRILSTQRFSGNIYQGVPAFSINHRVYYPQNTDPFLIDYLARSLLPDEPVEVAVFYGTPFGLTTEKLKKENFAKIIADVAPHNIEISWEEHTKHVGSYPYPHLTNSSFLWKLYSKHLRLADVVVVHSKKSAEYIQKKAELKNKPMVIPHGCYPPETTTGFPETFTVGHLSQFGWDKGQIYLLEAWRKLNPAYMQLVIAGNGTEIWNNVIQQNNIRNAKALGRITGVDCFYNSLTVYVQPSVTEGFGITALEAMAYGRPVIVSEGAGVSELIKDGREGFVIPIRDPVAITNRIQYFYNNPGEILRMGRNARKKAQQYTWSKIQEEYGKLFE